ncbi:MAG: M23 family metallopeptidase [Alphaproteobacteria bacterium]|nr:M23 family metallopeptidase [Alphaproteobacteria bacterium]
MVEDTHTDDFLSYGKDRLKNHQMVNGQDTESDSLDVYESHRSSIGSIDQGLVRNSVFANTIDGDDPFTLNTPKVNRWLITGSVAGVACTLAIGAALMGTLSGGYSPGTSTVAQLENSAQYAKAIGKSDLVIQGTLSSFTGSVANTSPIDAGYKKISVSFATGDNDLVVNGSRDSLQGGRLAGTLAPIYPDLEEIPLAYNNDGAQPLSPGEPQGSNTTTVAKTALPVPFTKTVSVEKGETLTGILVQLGVEENVVNTVVRSLNSVFPVRNVRVGQHLQFTLTKRRNFYGEHTVLPLKLVVLDANNPVAIAELDANGRYVAFVDSAATSPDLKPRRKPRVQTAALKGRVRTKAKIRKSLYLSAREHGVPEHIVANIMRVHSYDVDFQRQIRSGDSFEAYFGKPIAGKKTRRSVLLYSHLDLKGRKSKGYYRFTTPDDGLTGYYDLKGRSATKSLMRTPISGARVTSRYGMRRHPILGYSKMHAGIDFGATYGTPIKAAGSGVVEVARRVGAYGKYVRLKHNNGYKTAYAHMSRYARGIKSGAKVRQGQVIGYVGSTGRSTGPHLHYEVLRGERRINPLRVRIAGGRKLKGKMLEKFKRMVARVDSMRAKAPTTTRVAANEASQ